MKLKIYQVDAFTGTVFGGNPAAVVLLNDWPDDKVMQNIAMENNLSETAFYVKKDNAYELRWFTPTVEVDLCGHATLAAAHVLFHHEHHTDSTIVFKSLRSGDLTVHKDGNYLTLNFPADVIEKTEITAELTSCFDTMPVDAWKGKTDYLLVFENESRIEALVPNLQQIARLNARGVIATAKGDTVDFVSRFFAPQSGVNEDPVTGSAHTTLTPYWSKKLGKTELTAMQVSARRGFLKCKNAGTRIEISGQAKTYLVGEIVL
jgi:PhzF family phenazine biosynthesis protein